MEDEEKQIDGYNITEIKQYLEKNEEEYLRRFSQIHRKKEFNGAAALFGSVWFAYRMLWLEGILLWFLSSAILLFASFIICILVFGDWMCNKESGNLIFFLLWVVKFMVVGMLADSIYWRKIKKRINISHGEYKKKQNIIEQFANSIECKGVSVWSAVIMFFLLGPANGLVERLIVIMAILISGFYI